VDSGHISGAIQLRKSGLQSILLAFCISVPRSLSGRVLGILTIA